MRHDRYVLVAAAVIVAVVLIGEVYVYTFDRDSTYSADAYLSSDGVDYRVSSGVSNVYDVVVSDNGTFPAATEYYVYYDEGYADILEDAWHALGGKALDQEYYVSQMLHQLDNRGIRAEVLDATGLRDMVLSGGGSSKALIVVSGAFPDTVYSGDAADPIVRWISGGGSLYWVGNLLGAYVSSEDGIRAVGDYEALFFGAGTLNGSDSVKAYDEISDNGYLGALSLMSNSIRYSLNPGALSVPHLAVGYSDGIYASIVLAQYGSGMICVVGGDYSNNQRADLVQIVSAHLCYQSVLVGSDSGEVTRGTESGFVAFAADSGSRYSVYVYLGGFYLEYARCFDYVGITHT